MAGSDGTAVDWTAADATNAIAGLGIPDLGASGVVGPCGALGPCGGVGPCGAPGAGPCGAVGPCGSVGTGGPCGAVGPSGTAGPCGGLGVTGHCGGTGFCGSLGPCGSVGPCGALGPTVIAGDITVVNAPVNEIQTVALTGYGTRENEVQLITMTGLDQSGVNEIQTLSLVGFGAAEDEVQQVALNNYNDGTDEVQTIAAIAGFGAAETEVVTIDFDDIAAADTFTLTYNAHTTGAVTFNVNKETTASDIDAALAGLADFADDGTDLLVEWVSGNLYRITAAGTLVGTNLTAFTYTPTGFTGGAVTVVTQGHPADHFHLTYNSVASGAITYGAAAGTDVQTVLRALGGDLANCTVATASSPGPYLVTFTDVHDPGKEITVTGEDGCAGAGVTVTTPGVANDSFKLVGAVGTTAAFDYGACTQAALQSELRTATGNTDLTVTGTQDVGPFTVTFVGGAKNEPTLTTDTLVGCTVDVTTPTPGHAADSFKITVADTSEVGAFTHGACTAAAIEAALEAKGGDYAAMTVAGTQDVGPFSITFATAKKAQTLLVVSSISGCAGTAITLNTQGVLPDAFHITYGGAEGATDFIRGSNATAAALETAIRIQTGDGGLTVTGTTDTGPFTVTWSTYADETALSVTNPTTCSGIVTESVAGHNYDQYKLSWDGNKTGFLVQGTADAAAVKAAIEALAGFTGEVTIGTFSDTGYTVTFGGDFEYTDPGDLSVTDGTGCSGTVTVTTPGGVGLKDLSGTDVQTVLADIASKIATAKEITGARDETEGALANLLTALAALGIIDDNTTSS